MRRLNTKRRWKRNKIKYYYSIEDLPIPSGSYRMPHLSIYLQSILCVYMCAVLLYESVLSCLLFSYFPCVSLLLIKIHQLNKNVENCYRTYLTHLGHFFRYFDSHLYFIYILRWFLLFSFIHILFIHNLSLWEKIIYFIKLYRIIMIVTVFILFLYCICRDSTYIRQEAKCMLLRI